MLLIRLAFRNVFRQRRRSLLTGLSMSGGYLLLTLSLSLINGSYGNIIEYFIKDQTGHLQIHSADYLDRPRLYKNIENYETLYHLLESHEDVEAFGPRIRSQALAFHEKRSTPVQVTGVDFHREPLVSTLKQKITEGDYLREEPDNNGYYSALIGQSVADMLRISTGDELILLSQGADGSMANDIFIVNGIVGNRSSRDRLTVYLSLAIAQEFFTMHNRASEIAVILKDTDAARETALDLQGVIDTDKHVSPWQEIEETFYKTMEADKRGDRVMLGVIIFIVFIGVLNTVLMSVLERTREFGVLKAVGTRPVNLMALISLETILLAILSCLFGFLLSLPLIYWFTETGIALSQPLDIGGITFSHMRGEFSFHAFFTPLCVIGGSALVVSIPPGLRAARISPLDALGSH